MYGKRKSLSRGFRTVDPRAATAQKAVIERILDVEKLKYCFACGICTASCSMVELLGKDYNPRGLLEQIVLDPKRALASEELWLCAWCYRCYKRCPQALKLPEIFLLMRTASAKQGHAESLERALSRIVENIPLPLVTSMVCFHPERAGLSRDEVLARTEQLREQYVKPRKKKKPAGASDAKVAVVGSGPAGLTVASELSRKGYVVTVFESMPQAGGMMQKGIPEYRLPRRVLTKELEFIEGLGVEIRTGVTVGKDLSLDDFRKEGYRAVFVGTGAHKSQRLKIEGSGLKGVVNALDFLWKVNSGDRFEIGKRVVVIGGGNVAVDAARSALTARTALKMGAEEVVILYRRSREEMPANPWEVKEAEEEGVKLEFGVAPLKIVGEDKVSAIECIRTQLGEPDETGRRKATPIPGSEFKREADMVILAIGEMPDVGFLPKDVELNENGTIWVNPITMETSMPGVFAGGDVVTGPASVIEAIRAGKTAAGSIESYLESRR
jgi:NADPH-dependent glutamate synthase beta subunit-like oxidoreductase